MVKIIVNLYPTIAAASAEERRALRPIGRNSERYHEVLKGWMDIVRACDEMDGGVWGCSAIEHHFHSEGYEMSPNPGIINAYCAAMTKNVHVGQMGCVMSAHHPLRIAEETAILDHMLEGRSFVGFARGYQSRWTQVHGQHLGARATLSDNSSDDRLNREIFEENVDLVIKAWTQDSIEHNSPRWQIPYPHDTGVENWFMGDWTKELGAPGEMGEDGNLHAPALFLRPTRSRSRPFSFPATPARRRWSTAGARDSSPITSRRWRRRSPTRPRTFPRARNPARTTCWARTRRRRAGSRSVRTRPRSGTRWWSTTATSGSTSTPPLINGRIGDGSGDVMRRDATREDAVDPILGSGLWAAGTVAQVKDRLVNERKQMPAEYLTLILHYAQMPKEETIKTLVKEIKPDLDEITESVEKHAAAG